VEAKKEKVIRKVKRAKRGESLDRWVGVNAICDVQKMVLKVE
jgi:hypothetical protein